VAQTQEEIEKKGYSYVANIGGFKAYYKDDRDGGLAFVYNGVQYRMTAPNSVVDEKEQVEYLTAMANALIE